MVDGFCVERLLGSGRVGAVYEATQVSLGRAVALRLIEGSHFSEPGGLERFDEQQRLLASVHHPNLVATYAVGEWEGGRYVASRLIRGTTLETLLEQGLSPQVGALEPLASALAAVHEAGLIHGDVTAKTILVDANGACYLSAVGLDSRATAEADRQALASVMEAARSASAGSAVAGRAHRRALAALGACAIVALVAFLALGGDGDGSAEESPPVVAPGTTAFGSSLAGSAVMIGCSDVLSPNTPGCTLMQTRLPGRELVVPESGVVRSWVVRGGSGVVALQVVREDSKGRGFVAGFAQPETLSQSGFQQFDANVGVRAGDRIGLHLDPGASVGANAGVDAAAVTRWDGALTAEARRNDGSVAETELLLRADIEFGAEPEAPDQLVGRAAATAPRGEVLSPAPMTLSVRNGVRVLVVELDGGVVIDVFDDGRLSRIEVPDADVDGRLVDVSQECGPSAPGGFCFRWTNPGQPVPLEHQYIVRPDGSVSFIG